MNGLLTAAFLLLSFQDNPQTHARFSGRILDAKTGCDVRGLVNFLRISRKIPDDDISVLTQRNGWYEAAVPRTGHYRIVAVARGYRPSILEMDVQTIPAWHQVNFKLRKGVPLTLKIQDQKGKGIEGAWATLSYLGGEPSGALEWAYLQVHAGGDTGQSKNGILFWEGLPPGRWRVRVTKPGYIPKVFETRRRKGTLVLEEGRLVLLTVQNADGTAAPDVLVTVSSGGRVVYTGISGAYGDMAATLVPGTNDLILYRLPGGRKSMRKRIDIPRGERLKRITIRWGPP